MKMQIQQFFFSFLIIYNHQTIKNNNILTIIFLYTQNSYNFKMGNQCDQCEAITEGCKRDQFRNQLKNRQKLDLSKIHQASSNGLTQKKNSNIKQYQNHQTQLKKSNSSKIKKPIKQMEQIKQSQLQYINSPQQNSEQLNKQNAVGYINVKMKKTNTSVIDDYFQTNKSNGQHQQKQKYTQNKRVQEQDKIIYKSNNRQKFNNQIKQIDHKFHFQLEKKEMYKQNSTSEYDYDKFIKDQVDVIEQYQNLVKPNLAFQGFKSNDQIHNKGSFRWQDGTILSTVFKKGKVQNQVLVNFANKSVYQGNLKNYQANGKGKLLLKDGSYYAGQWVDNLPHGIGKQKMTNGSIYQGEFQRGFKNGQGHITFEDGTVYEGGFYSDKFSGEGKLLIADRMYIGTFRDGYLEGQGQLIYKDGVKYIGNFKQSKKEGEGTYFYEDGREWAGQWKDNRQNGHGKYKNFNGQIVQGYWIDGIKSQSKLRLN